MSGASTGWKVSCQAGNIGYPCHDSCQPSGQHCGQVSTSAQASGGMQDHQSAPCSHMSAPGNWSCGICWPQICSCSKCCSAARFKSSSCSSTSVCCSARKLSSSPPNTFTLTASFDAACCFAFRLFVLPIEVTCCVFSHAASAVKENAEERQETSIFKGSALNSCDAGGSASIAVIRTVAAAIFKLVIKAGCGSNENLLWKGCVSLN
mmetsp:Transcript_119947/g.188154  ORF Transcript_119947/g.188154 Transcript_119947/m.188154 type:complete len:207 (-) Transcript_119947:65-685(-)